MRKVAADFLRRAADEHPLIQLEKLTQLLCTIELNGVAAGRRGEGGQPHATQVWRKQK